MIKPRRLIVPALIALAIFVFAYAIGGDHARSKHDAAVLAAIAETQTSVLETLNTLKGAIASAPANTRATLLDLEADLAAQARAIAQTVRLRQQGTPATIVVTRTRTRVLVRCELPNGKACPNG